MNFPDEKYQIVYADPAWKYNFGETSSRFVNKKYTVMDKQSIMDLPIANISAANSVLLLWITFPKLDWAFDVISAWGYTYKTCAFTWVKTNKKSDTLFWGMGYYTRSNAEICLLATKGKPLKRLSHSIHSIIRSPLMRHSQKPGVIREKIVELFGDIPRIELFAREEYKGWDVLGDGIDGVDMRESLELLVEWFKL